MSSAATSRARSRQASRVRQRVRAAGAAYGGARPLPARAARAPSSRKFATMADYCIDTSGKRIRPALVFSAAGGDRAISPDLVRVAAVVELVHLATLVHDDIMDEADVRRSRRTAAREYGADRGGVAGRCACSPTRCISRRSFPPPKSARRFPNPPAGFAPAKSCRRCGAARPISRARTISASLT